jgi:CheY-like chemotaxis protein
VIDDGVIQRVAICAILARWMSLSSRLTLAAARGALSVGQRFAVIVMDVQMTEMEGWETADPIRQCHESSRIPILFVTAFERQDGRASPVGHQNGAIDFISPLVVPDVLRAKVSRFVDVFRESRFLDRRRE